MCFRTTDDVTSRAPIIESYVHQAIATEDAGIEMNPAAPLELVAELQARLETDSALDTLRNAFVALMPGRQRAHHLHISSAKQSATRHSRIDRCAPQTLAGKGPRDR